MQNYAFDSDTEITRFVVFQPRVLILNNVRMMKTLQCSDFAQRPHEPRPIVTARDQ
jgi:hypothetical protein